MALYFIVLTGLSPVSLASDSTANPDFVAGVAAFGEGDLATARAYFEQARADGLNSPSLLYNLGVVYFRLGRHDSAEAVFKELLDTPHAPLARYNLGLVMQQTGQDQAARHWFEQAAGPESPEKVQVLANRRLDEIKPGESDPVSSSGYLSAAVGYDGNIAGTPDDASSNQAGGFADLLAVGEVDVSSGFGLQAVAYSRKYPRHTEFDTSYLSAGASWLTAVGGGELTSTLSMAGSWFGGDTLEREIRLEAEYRPDQCLLAAKVSGLECSVRGSVSAINGGSNFSAYDGEMLRLGFGVSKREGSWLFMGRYRFEVNDREDLSTQQEFFSVSPLRNLFSAEARYQVSSRISLGARGDVRHSRYQDDHQLVSATGVVTERRTDNRLRGVLLAEYRLAGPWLVLAEWSMLNNRSTIERYDYSRREAMIGVEMGF